MNEQDAKRLAREIGREIQEATGLYPTTQVIRIAKALLDATRESEAEVARLTADNESLTATHDQAIIDQLAQQSIDLGNAISRANEAEDERDRLRRALEEARRSFETINEVASPNPVRTIMVDGTIRDLGWCCDEARRALARIREALGDV